MATKPLKRWSTDELETAIYSGSLDNIQRYEAERIISERERAPERRLARRSYNAAAWALAFSMGTFIVAELALGFAASVHVSCGRIRGLATPAEATLAETTFLSFGSSRESWLA
jgi:hypothetical protein